MEADIPLRCLAYTSRSNQNWTDADLRELAERAGTRNLALGITGRLLFAQGRFIQVLEGAALAPQDLYHRIRRDPRHADVTLLIDMRVGTRSYPSCGMELLTEHDLTPEQTSSVLSQVEKAAQEPAISWDSLLGSIRKLEAGRPAAAVNTTPRQSRADVTLDRLLAAARSVLLRDGLTDASMKAVAAEANVSLNTAYRYFSSTEQIVGLMVHRWQTSRIANFAGRLAELRVDNEAQLAGEIADNVSQQYLSNDLIPLRIRLVALRDYHRIAYAELWAFAGLVVQTLERNGLTSADPTRQERIAMALAGIAAQAKMAALHAPDQLHGTRFRDDMASTLTRAMRGAEPAPGA